jgi:hypothetical protein
MYDGVRVQTPSVDAITIRRARPDDAARLRDLAVLDSASSLEKASLLAGPTLVAEIDGELWAARLLDGTTTIGDPFRPTAHARELLAVRAHALTEQVDQERLVSRLARGILRRPASA